MMTDLIKRLNDLTVLSDTQKRLFELFDRLEIVSETWEHLAIFTVAEGMELNLHHHIKGQGGKSLLLTNKKGDLWLVIACDETRTDIKSLADHLESGRLSFAKPETMQEVIGVTPGSATPFALINDADHQINVVIDEKFLEQEKCVFHPLVNTMSTIIRFEDLLRFLTHSGYEPLIICLETPISAA